ncbi:hypothetical protein OAE17_04410 [Gammaproteobacteria bacterium]|nr:hypothetical protein [Gammaproteobacteria bacterium]
MKLWIFNFTDPPPQKSNLQKRRHEAVAFKLMHLGHNVHWVLDSFSHTKKTYISKEDVLVESGLSVTVIPSLGYKKNISLKRILHNIFLAIVSSYTLLKKIYINGKPDKVLVSFPSIEVSFALSLICRALNIPFYIDFRDLHPEVFLTIKKNKLLRFLIFLFIIPYSFMVKIILRNAHRVFTTSPSVSKYLQKKYKLKNTPNSFFHCFEGSDIHKDGDSALVKKIQNYKTQCVNPIIFSYCGTLSTRLDLITFVRAFKALEDKSNILCICGSGDMLNMLLQEAHGHENIFINSEISRQEVSRIYKISNFGILPYPEALDFQLAPPTKLSEMLFYDLTIISSESTYLQRNLLSEVNSVFYKFANLESLSLSIQDVSNKIFKSEVNHLCYKKYFSSQELDKMTEEILF